MEMKIQTVGPKMIVTFLSLLSVVLVSHASYAGSTPQKARGIVVGASYITDWDEDCGPADHLASLSYNEDIIKSFVKKMQEYGATKEFLFSNTTTWATDLEDSTLYSAGDDSTYADNVTIFAYQGHGGASGSSFWATMCLGNNWKERYSEDKARDLARFSSRRARFDQDLRWLIMSTCDSMGNDDSATRPDRIWSPAAGPKFEYIMGFRNLSYSGPTTDEVLEDWVTEAIGKDRSFKQAWFYAGDDWWFAMTPSVIAFDDKWGDAINRRDSQRYYWTRRNATGRTTNRSTNNVAAWAWKEWGGTYPARRTKPERQDYATYVSTN